MADIPITGTNVKLTSSGTPTPIQLGETMVAGDIFYLSGGKAYLATSTDTSAKATAAGMLLSGGTADQWVTYARSGDTLTISGATFTVGAMYVLSATNGKFAPYADLLSTEYVSIIGVPSATTVLKLTINNTGVAKA